MESEIHITTNHEKQKPTEITKWIESTNHSEERNLLTPCQQTMKNINLQNGLKFTNHSEESDLLTPFIS